MALEFEKQGVWCAGKLSKEVLDDVDTRLYIGLCMGSQDEVKDGESELGIKKDVV